MAVRSAVDIGSRGVDRRVNHVCRGVEQAIWSAVNDFAGVIDKLVLC